MRTRKVIKVEGMCTGTYPGTTCTYCGDCITKCKSASIHYTFPGLKPDNARKLYITVTEVIYSLVLALARI